MSRSGYDDSGEYSEWSQICWRGAVASAFRGKRGQSFLREMLVAMDAMPEKKLIREEIVTKSGEVCAMGTVARARGLDVLEIDPEEREVVAKVFGIPQALVAEITYYNDEYCAYSTETPEQRFDRMRAWVVSKIQAEVR